MVNIGFDDQLDDLFDLEEQESDKPSKDLNEVKLIQFTDRRVKQFLDEYGTVVVHDFHDEYHLSDEERRKKNENYEEFKKFSKYKKKYRKVDEFVMVMREGLKLLDKVAETNGVYSPKKFKKLFLKGDIFINGLTLPKLTGKERKNVSWEYLTEFILSDEPIENLLYNRNKKNLLTEEEEDDALECFKMQHPDVYADIVKSIETGENNKGRDVERDGCYTKKDMKIIRKMMPELVNWNKEYNRKRQIKDSLDGYAYQLTVDDIDNISKYERRKLKIRDKEPEIPVFNGDIDNYDDYNDYMGKLYDYENNNILEFYNGQYKSRRQIKEIEFRVALEQAGWNVKALYGNKEREKKMKKQVKEDREKERRIKAKLKEIQERRRDRRLDDDEFDVDTKKSKKKKKQKKKSTKKKLKKAEKKEKKLEKKRKKAIEKAKKDVSSFLMEEYSDGRSYKEWKDESFDWTWDSINKTE